MADRPIINDVSDTALWVAVYRERETERPDALFLDPLAKRMTGEKGKRIAAKMAGSRYTAWSVVIRTCIIDAYIGKLVAEGADTVINLGAGLDTRPYRLDLPKSLRWVEVDYPHMIQRKEELLADQAPRCALERVRLDLSDELARRKFFSEVAQRSKKAVILTEGVLPYLAEEQVVSLAADLSSQACFRFWIVDYFSPQIIRHVRTPKRMRQMRNAPFRFLPKDFFGFFERNGWKEREIRYLGEESEKLGRLPPMPWWASLIRMLFRPRAWKSFRKFAGYVVLEPKGAEPHPLS